MVISELRSEVKGLRASPFTHSIEYTLLVASIHMVPVKY